MKEKAINSKYVYRSSGFAIFPTKTIDNGWVWFKKIYLVIDERPLVFLGLNEETYYYMSETERNNDYDIYKTI